MLSTLSLGSKIGLGFGLLGLVLVVLYFLGKKSASATVQINASSAEVWNALTQKAEVEKWNTVLVPLEGSLIAGSTITYNFREQADGKAVEIKASVFEVNSEKLINQKGGLPLVLTFDHKYMLEEKDGGVEVKIYEEYRGIMVPFWNPSGVEKAYERLLADLKTHLEK